MIQECLSRNGNVMVKVNQALSGMLVMQIQVGKDFKNVVEDDMIQWTEANAEVQNIRELATCLNDIAAQIESRIPKEGELDDLLDELAIGAKGEARFKAEITDDPE